MDKINWGMFIPIILYFILIHYLGYRANKKVKEEMARGGEFIETYTHGNRSTGGFVLAMTLIASYLSAGSFIGGPGTAYKVGLGWVFLAMSQMPTGYFTISVLGKKFAIIARKIKANTVTDFLRERYESDLLVILASFSIIAFLIAAMSAQWIGAARLLEGSLGLPYIFCLVFFGLTVIIHTTIGGYKGVSLNDSLQGIVMTITTLILFITIVVKGGGIANIVENMKAIDPGLITPFGVEGGPSMTKAWVTSFWILVGFSTIGLPAISQRAMSYKDSKSAHDGIKIGTLISIILLLGMHLIGAFGIVLVPGIEVGDHVIPSLLSSLFPPVIAGFLLAGPLAAVISTVDSQLLIVVGTIVNDLQKRYFKKDLKEKEIKNYTYFWAIFLGVISFIFALRPPELMVWINLFATAGQVSAFLWPTILGLYWKKANSKGAISSMIVGIVSYIAYNQKILLVPFGVHPIVVSLVLSLLAFLIVSYLTEEPREEVIQKFWGL